MKTQREYMDFIKKEFNHHIGCNLHILDAYSYRDHRATDCIGAFSKVVRESGLKFSHCYHSSGIGNNNDYTIFIEETDADGFVIQKNIANFYYCYGIFGGCYVRLTDLTTNEKITVGHAH